MRLDTVTGYAHDGEIYCVDCAVLLNAQICEGYGECPINVYTGVHELDDNGVCMSQFGVVFVSHESDSAQSCGICFENVETNVLMCPMHDSYECRDHYNESGCSLDNNE